MFVGWAVRGHAFGLPPGRVAEELTLYRYRFVREGAVRVWTEVGSFLRVVLASPLVRFCMLPCTGDHRRQRLTRFF